ncbi:MAG TPA: hypothetical protein EYP89_04490 [Candidatus Omnitrophica bacterium]|nr:hypothetical protein [Candidatus Omnitrophota bacterium]
MYCKDCWLKRRERGRRERGFRSEPVQGNWQCADCGQTITELPFNPAADRPIYCRECWRKKKEQELSY